MVYVLLHRENVFKFIGNGFNSDWTILLALFIFSFPKRVNNSYSYSFSFSFSFSNYHFFKKFSNRFIALCFGGLSVLIRPTSAIFWAFLGIHHLLFETKSINNAFKLVFFQVFPVAIGVIALALGTDYLFYGKLVFVPFNFLQFNIVKDFARFYGTHPWHWYFSQGFIGMVGSMNIFLAIGVYLSSAKQRLLFWIVLLNLILLSFQAHKEFRYL